MTRHYFWLMLGALFVLGLIKCDYQAELVIIGASILTAAFWKKTRSGCAFYLTSGLLVWVILIFVFLAQGYRP